MACDSCDGTGVIYDWNKKGDPCPECTGGRFHASSVLRIHAQDTIYNAKAKSGCLVIPVTCLMMTVILAIVLVTRQS